MFQVLNFFVSFLFLIKRRTSSENLRYSQHDNEESEKRVLENFLIGQIEYEIIKKLLDIYNQMVDIQTS